VLFIASVAIPTMWRAVVVASLAGAVADGSPGVSRKDSEDCLADGAPPTGSSLLQVAAGKSDEGKLAKWEGPALSEDEASSFTLSRGEASGEHQTGSKGIGSVVSFCYEASSFDDCWSKKPAAPAACDASSGTTVCACPDSFCTIDELKRKPPSIGWCDDKVVYVEAGDTHVNSNTGEVAVTGTGEKVMCQNMVKYDQWEAKHLVARDSDGPAENSRGYWSCWSRNGHAWHDGKCRRSQRYLGEKCWGGSKWYRSTRPGSCAGSTSGYDHYSTSCYAGVCVPKAWAQQKQQCECAWVGWNLIAVCSAANNACDGHACVLNTGDGKKYCDYSTAQDWTTLV